MLFWKDVGNGILLDRPLLFKLHQSYRPLPLCIREINPATKSGRDSRCNADLDCCDARLSFVRCAALSSSAFSFNCSVLQLNWIIFITIKLYYYLLLYCGKDCKEIDNETEWVLQPCLELTDWRGFEAAANDLDELSLRISVFERTCAFLPRLI